MFLPAPNASCPLRRQKRFCLVHRFRVLRELRGPWWGFPIRLRTEPSEGFPDSHRMYRCGDSQTRRGQGQVLQPLWELMSDSLLTTVGKSDPALTLSSFSFKSISPSLIAFLLFPLLPLLLSLEDVLPLS